MTKESRPSALSCQVYQQHIEHFGEPHDGIVFDDSTAANALPDHLPPRIEVLVWHPTPDLDISSFSTIGMSDKPMRDAEHRAELHFAVRMKLSPHEINACRHSSFRTERDRNRLHHPPTDASIQAVASFVADPSHFVRHAVATTLSAHPDAARVSIKTFIKLLGDTDASVRIAAADAIQEASVFLEDATELVPFLADSMWSVRWRVASALANTCFRQDAWAALKDSLPTANPHFLDSWARRASLFLPELRSEPETVATIRDHESFWCYCQLLAPTA